MAFLTAALAILTLVASPESEAGQPSEYEVKAAFLFNFAKFVDWPEGTFPPAGGLFTICVLGDEAFRETLGRIVAGKTLGGHSIEITAVSEASQIGTCQMLFVNSLSDKRTQSVLNGAGLGFSGNRRGILTVADSEGAAAGTTIIRFLMENGKVRFEVDAAAAERAGLHVSARLLSLAQVHRK